MNNVQPRAISDGGRGCDVYHLLIVIAPFGRVYLVVMHGAERNEIRAAQ